MNSRCYIYLLSISFCIITDVMNLVMIFQFSLFSSIVRSNDATSSKYFSLFTSSFLPIATSDFKNWCISQYYVSDCKTMWMIPYLKSVQIVSKIYMANPHLCQVVSYFPYFHLTYTRRPGSASQSINLHNHLSSII